MHCWYHWNNMYSACFCWQRNDWENAFDVLQSWLWLPHYSQTNFLILLWATVEGVLLVEFWMTDEDIWESKIEDRKMLQSCHWYIHPLFKIQRPEFCQNQLADLIFEKKESSGSSDCTDQALHIHCRSVETSTGLESRSLQQKKVSELAMRDYLPTVWKHTSQLFSFCWRKNLCTFLLLKQSMLICVFFDILCYRFCNQ